MLLKCCTQYVSKFEKLNSGHRTRKGQFSFQSQKRAMPKKIQTTVQLGSFHMLIRWWSKPFKLSFSSMWTEYFQMYKLGFQEAEESDQIVNIRWVMEKTRKFQKNTYFCFIDYTKTFDCVVHNKLWKILQKMENSSKILQENSSTRSPYQSPEKTVCRSRSNS